MVHTLHQSLLALTKNLDGTENLVMAASQWGQVRFPSGVPRFSVRHKEIITELAFLRAFLAWELFLEETFVLYLLGQTAPRGRPPYRFVFPPTRRGALHLILPEGRDYVSWSVASTVAARAERFFRDGRPFSAALQSQMTILNDMRTIRNAIAHWQARTQQKFKALVRTKTSTGTFPSSLTVGAFLAGTVPSSAPPESFFTDYVNRIRYIADRIVPS